MAATAYLLESSGYLAGLSGNHHELDVSVFTIDANLPMKPDGAGDEPNYIRWLRNRVGHEPIQLNFAVGCVCESDRILLQRRGDQNVWGIPGGGIELDESADEAVLREIYEETGLLVRVDGLLGVYTKYRHHYPNGDVAQTLAVFFRCSPIGGELRVDGAETLELRYFQLNDTPDLSIKQHADALADLRAGRVGVFR